MPSPANNFPVRRVVPRFTPWNERRQGTEQRVRALARATWMLKRSQPWESNPQPPHYECGALPIEARLAQDPLLARSATSESLQAVQFISRPI
jgi:hypothetical protein